jgi:hypothetical protein
MQESCPPVLLVVFNRPKATAMVMRALAVARPAHLYVAADGPRDDSDRASCEEARRLSTDVTWPCVLKMRFLASNVGTKTAVSSAVDWFFEHEREGIILEDDCVPDPSFFEYCRILLARYRDDYRVMSVSGGNYQFGQKVSDFSYHFSRYHHCRGWATWRRAWNFYDGNLRDLEHFNQLEGYKALSNNEPGFEAFFPLVFNAVKEGRLKSWALAWTFSCWMQGGFSCVPERNLVRNLGFWVDGAHTRDAESWLAALATESLSFPLRHPPGVVRSFAADNYVDRVVYGTSRYVRVKSPQRI